MSRPEGSPGSPFEVEHCHTLGAVSSGCNLPSWRDQVQGGWKAEQNWRRNWCGTVCRNVQGCDELARNVFPRCNICQNSDVRKGKCLCITLSSHVLNNVKQYDKDHIISKNVKFC